MQYKIIVAHSENFKDCNTDILVQKLKIITGSSDKFDIFLSSDFNICPYIVAFKDDDGKLMVQNINEGFINGISNNENVEIISASNLDEFVYSLYNLYNSKEINTLF